MNSSASNIKELITVPIDEIKRQINSTDKTLWIGALSFEARCTGSVKAMKQCGIKVFEGILIDYAKEAIPRELAERRKIINLTIMENLKGLVFENEIRTINVLSYEFYAVQRVMATIERDYENISIIIDITCMTKLHSISIAAYLARSSIRNNWIVTYCTPETYGSLDGERNEAAWIDIMVIPIANTAKMLNENNGRGLIFPGHESDRLIVALGEIEPPGGMIAMAETIGRPDLRKLSERLNKTILAQITSIRKNAWEKRYISIEQPDKITLSIMQQIAHAKQHDAPIIMYPMGPKPPIYVSAYLLSRYYPEGSWIVYPMPSNYDAEYSDGIGDSIWIVSK